MMSTNYGDSSPRRGPAGEPVVLPGSKVRRVIRRHRSDSTSTIGSRPSVLGSLTNTVRYAILNSGWEANVGGFANRDHQQHPPRPDGAAGPGQQKRNGPPSDRSLQRGGRKSGSTTVIIPTAKGTKRLQGHQQQMLLASGGSDDLLRVGSDSSPDCSPKSRSSRGSRSTNNLRKKKSGRGSSGRSLGGRVGPRPVDDVLNNASAGRHVYGVEPVKVFGDDASDSSSTGSLDGVAAIVTAIKKDAHEGSKQTKKINNKIVDHEKRALACGLVPAPPRPDQDRSVPDAPATTLVPREPQTARPSVSRRQSRLAIATFVPATSRRDRSTEGPEEGIEWGREHTNANNHGEKKLPFTAMLAAAKLHEKTHRSRATSAKHRGCDPSEADLSNRDGLGLRQLMLEAPHKGAGITGRQTAGTLQSNRNKLIEDLEWTGQRLGNFLRLGDAKGKMSAGGDGGDGGTSKGRTVVADTVATPTKDDLDLLSPRSRVRTLFQPKTQVTHTNERFATRDWVKKRLLKLRNDDVEMKNFDLYCQHVEMQRADVRATHRKQCRRSGSTSPRPTLLPGATQAKLLEAKERRGDIRNDGKEAVVAEQERRAEFAASWPHRRWSTFVTLSLFMYPLMEVALKRRIKDERRESFTGRKLQLKSIFDLTVKVQSDRAYKRLCRAITAVMLNLSMSIRIRRKRNAIRSIRQYFSERRNMEFILRLLRSYKLKVIHCQRLYRAWHKRRERKLARWYEWFREIETDALESGAVQPSRSLMELDSKSGFEFLPLGSEGDSGSGSGGAIVEIIKPRKMVRQRRESKSAMRAVCVPLSWVRSRLDTYCTYLVHDLLHAQRDYVRRFAVYVAQYKQYVRLAGIASSSTSPASGGTPAGSRPPMQAPERPAPPSMPAVTKSSLTTIVHRCMKDYYAFVDKFGRRASLDNTLVSANSASVFKREDSIADSAVLAEVARQAVTAEPRGRGASTSLSRSGSHVSGTTTARAVPSAHTASFGSSTGAPAADSEPNRC